MSSLSLYLLVKQVHVGSVIFSFALFLFRGGLLFANIRWRRHVVLRIAPHLIDTILLTSALFLASLLHQYPFVHGWLTVKVLALVAYIIFGSMALKRAATRRAQVGWFLLAVLVFGFIVSVARAHHPLGLFTYF